MSIYMPHHFYCTSCGVVNYSNGDQPTHRCSTCGHINHVGQFFRPSDWYEWSGETNVIYNSDGDDDSGIVLQDSMGIPRFYELENNLILGSEWHWYCYDSSFIRKGYEPGKRDGPMALWDAKTGTRLQTLKGYHYGYLRGAQLLNDVRLITWARDFLIHIWDVQSGERLGTLPLPAALNDDQVPIVASRSFNELTAQQRERYINNHDRLSFNVKLMIKASNNTQCKILGPYSNAIPEGMTFKHFEFPKDNRWFNPFQFQELENVEGGYSTERRTSDGRLIIGGTTYGATGYVYVWDGGLNLTILYSGLSVSNFDIEGEIRPGVIQVGDLDEIMIFENV